jgi:pyrimidine 5'-nucleotidase
MFHTLFLDLDNTLYPKSSGLMDAIRGRIISYMREIMGLEDGEITSIRQYSLKKYGTTLTGLMESYDVDPQRYMKYVHDLTLSDFIKRDSRIPKIIKSLPQKKIIFSNAHPEHIQRVLDFLGLTHLIDFIVDAHMLMPKVKPQPEAFHKALRLAGLDSWEGCAFVDDSVPNIQAAEALGIYSILVDEEGETTHANRIASITSLPEKLAPQKRN